MALPRDRQSPASSGPNPGTSPGDCDKPSQVPSGIVKLIIPADSEPEAPSGGSKEVTGWPVSSAVKT